MLTTLNCQQSSVCRGIPEEKLLTWASRSNIQHILLERFSSKVLHTLLYSYLKTSSVSILANITSCAYR